MREQSMPVTEDLQGIAELANQQLDDVYDFYENSKVVWRYFQALVNEGHRVAWKNLATGSDIDQVRLVNLAPQYIRDYLATFTFRQFVSVFEVFLLDFLHRLLLHNPWQFARKQLEFEAVLAAGDRDEIISDVILRQLNELKYDQLRAWFVVMNKTVKLDLPTEDEIDALAEVKATRDILEHNAGVVNETYRRKAGRKARYAIGDRVRIDDAYHLDSWRLIKKVMADVSTAAVAKLATS
jgi:hypothetical protein